MCVCVWGVQGGLSFRGFFEGSKLWGFRGAALKWFRGRVRHVARRKKSNCSTSQASRMWSKWIQVAWLHVLAPRLASSGCPNGAAGLEVRFEVEGLYMGGGGVHCMTGPIKLGPSNGWRHQELQKA